MSPGPSSPFFSILPTSYGGRGVIASQNIPKDSLILSCEAPYASVICRKFRKEVCAWCFSWSWEIRKSSWALTIPLESQRPASSVKPASGAFQSSFRFCGESCRNYWLADGEDTMDSGHVTSHAGIRGLINSSLERCITAMAKSRTKSRNLSPLHEIEFRWIVFLQDLEGLNPNRISSNFVEDTWKRAEQLASFLWASKPFANEQSLSNKTRPPKVGHIFPIILSELELDTASFILSCLVKKCIEESSRMTSRAYEGRPHYSVGTWSDVLDLQDNSLPQIRMEPYMLASHIRIWAFIKFVVYSALRDAKCLSDRTKDLVQSLKKSVDTPKDTQAILGRESGNVFGLWDSAPEGEDNEMLGWGLYPLGSYFNHGMSTRICFDSWEICYCLDCSPVVHKRMNGRFTEFYTLHDVHAGEELCISYIKENDEAQKRRKALKRWFFECACKKCTVELQVWSLSCSCSTSPGMNDLHFCFPRLISLSDLYDFVQRIGLLSQYANSLGALWPLIYPYVRCWRFPSLSFS